jgi:integrase
MICDGLGLWLKTKPAKGGGFTRSWLFRFAIDGKKDSMGFGGYPDCSLAEARDRRDAARKLLRDGVNPKTERDRRRAEQKLADRPVVLFRDAATQYIATHERGWSAKHSEGWTDTLTRFAFPVIGALAVDAIDVAAVLRVLQPHWESKRETMARLRGRIESVLAAATAAGLRSGENPASWLTLKHLLAPKPKNGGKQHFAALPYAEVGPFMAELEKIDSVASRALRFLTLTAARTGEVRNATWDEIDFKARTWTVPAAKMKGGVEHKVPLSDAALAVLEEMRELRTGGRVFELGIVGMNKLINRMGYREKTTTHGLRSTFRDWCAEKTNVQNFIAEKALAHAIPVAVEAAYRRGNLFEKRRKLMNQWGRYCTQPAKRAKREPRKAAASQGDRKLQSGGEVIEFARRRAARHRPA